MGVGVRLFLSTAQQDLISFVRTAFSKKTYTESIISITRPKLIENKLDRNNINILLWDLSLERHDTAWVNRIRKIFDLHIIYTSFDSNIPEVLGQYGKDEFISKPAIFTSVTTPRYIGEMERAVEGFIARSQRPLSMRDLAKSISDKEKIIAIAASTGGTNALEEIIKHIPMDSPPIVIVQHMPSGFTKLFAERLDGLYKHNVREAQTGDSLMRGCILLAPADKHIRVIKRQGRLIVDCYVGNRVHGVMPAADILFESVAKTVKNNAVGVVLTGMGNDGAKGLMQMRNAGCKTIGQNEATCVVYGMPKAAKDLGAIEYELPISKIAEKIMELVR